MRARNSSACNCIDRCCRGGCLSRKKKSVRERPLRTAAATTSNQFLDRLEVRILLCDLAERRIHSETGEQMHLRRFRIAKKGVVATHVVVINRFAQKCDRPSQKKFLGLERFAQFVQTKTGVKIT